MLVSLPNQLHCFINVTRMGAASDLLWVHLLTLSHLARSQIYRPSTTHTSRQLGLARRHQPSPSVLQCITSVALLRVVLPRSSIQRQSRNLTYPLTQHYSLMRQGLLGLPRAFPSTTFVDYQRVALPVNQRARLNVIHVRTRALRMTIRMICLM